MAVSRSHDTPGIPAAPWRKGRAGKQPAPQRMPLSADLIVDAALRIAGAEGIDALTMRRIAQEFDTGPSSIYAHVINKDELLDLMLDRVAAGIQVPKADPEHWQEQARDVARAIYQVFSANADVARIALATIPTGPNMLRVTEGLLAVLVAGGVPIQHAAWSVDRILLYISADAYEGSQFMARQRESGLPIHEFGPAFREQVRTFYASLPSESFPCTSANADILTTGGGDERFEFGLDLILTGLAAKLPAPDA
ncbi:TetR/AcrR family transcriptional regulator [Kitasatospora sp. NBC_00240]|uniref:TetR/AcrR family transcriptional regulator n=1 Tax=Kitasatospora sp. NBC_00240 TaxID=2903567 RepID=UPI00224CDBF2|nr:TetR/AcrR family transcriptional regulator [Kitasatospora sp. NBC_00240]MCX5212776.1 TetR/AcrR family transcriptional regulator [Kitasatospora sp. NBC_00240]